MRRLLPSGQRPDDGGESQRSLTTRELEVLRLLPTRLSVIDIAFNLRISPNTVKTHLKSIYRKLGVRTRNEAILNAARCHLLPADSAALVR